MLLRPSSAAMRNTFLSMMFVLLAGSAASAQSNWVADFLARYTPSTASETAESPEAPVDQLLTQPGELPLSTADIVRLLLVNNRDIVFNRLIPSSSMYTMEALFRPFQPNIHMNALVDRTKALSRSQLIGAPALNQLTHTLNVGIDEKLPSGTAVSADFAMNRISSNSAFDVYNPSWAGGLSYSVTQPFLRNFGRDINTHLIRIARANQKISEAQFELAVVNMVTQAEIAYWDFVFASENINVKQRALNLAERLEKENQAQVKLGLIAATDIIQSQAEVATRREALVIAEHDAQLVQD